MAMATPSDIISHYSNQALLTRLAALTFVGGVVGGAWDKLEQPPIGTVVGLALIVVVGSLSELNRRYTHSYLSACRAAAEPLDGDNPQDRMTAKRWKYFYAWNEEPWKQKVSRFFLNWLTYVPGLLLGVFLVGKSHWHEQGWKNPWLLLAVLLVCGFAVWTTLPKAFRYLKRIRNKRRDGANGVTGQ